MGPPFFIWFFKKGTTDPVDPKTLPNLTIEKVELLLNLKFAEYTFHIIFLMHP